MKILAILATLVCSLCYASQPPPPRTLSLLKLQAVVEQIPVTLELEEKLIATRDLPGSKYLIEKRDRNGDCTTQLFDLIIIPGQIPGFFTIKAELAADQGQYVCEVK